MTQEEILVLMKTDPEKGMLNLAEQYTALVWKVVWGKLSGICQEEDVEETVSDVFLDFYRKHNTVDLSKGSLAKPFTTRIARTFSSIDSLRRSYFLKTLRKAGIAFLATIKRPKPSKGITTTNEVASAPPIIYAIIIEKISNIGARTAILIIIIYDI